MIPVLEPCFQGVPDMWFFSTVLFLLIVICSVAGVVNALAVRRELHARREQEYHARGRTATGERSMFRCSGLPAFRLNYL